MGLFSRRPPAPAAPPFPAPRQAARQWLDVPFSEKDEAKSAGARWDPAAERWYAPPGRMRQLEQWAALPDLPELLPGEDRTLGDGLFVDLVPQSCWWTNTRSALREESWDRVRRMVYRRAGNRCEACDASRADGARLEAHERWEYAGGVQYLRRLICLCQPCHTTTHMGLAQIRGVAGRAVQHLMDVTHMTPAQAGAHIEAAFATWRTRSAQSWELDLSMLSGLGLRLTPEAAARRDAARKTGRPAGWVPRVMPSRHDDPEDAEAASGNTTATITPIYGDVGEWLSGH